MIDLNEVFINMIGEIVRRDNFYLYFGSEDEKDLFFITDLEKINDEDQSKKLILFKGYKI